MKNHTVPKKQHYLNGALSVNVIYWMIKNSLKNKKLQEGPGWYLKGELRRRRGRRVDREWGKKTMTVKKERNNKNDTFAAGKYSNCTWIVYTHGFLPQAFYYWKQYDGGYIDTDGF